MVDAVVLATPVYKVSRVLKVVIQESKEPRDSKVFKETREPRDKPVHKAPVVMLH